MTQRNRATKLWSMPDNLTPNPFPSGKGNRIYLSESKRASSPFCD